MLRSCKYCGRIHDSRYDCGHKPKRKIRYIDYNADPAKFRRREAWKQMSLSIRARDNNICQVCLHLYLSGKAPAIKLSTLISVHHIKSIGTHPELALERTNLITLCSQHHEEAENGEINADWLTDLATRAEEKA